MRFDDLFVRTSVADLQTLLTPTALKLINLLDRRSVSIEALRQVAKDLGGGQVGLLLDATARNILFDLLRKPEATELLKVLDETCSDDPYIALKQLSFRSKSQKEALLQFFGLVSPLPEKRSDVLVSENTLPASYSLFSHQRDAVKRVKEKLSKRPHRTILHMPTGSGKTRTAMNVIAEHLREHEPTIVIWLAHSEELCEQAAEEFESCWQSLGNRTVYIYRFWGSHEIDMESLSDGVVVAGLAKVYSRTKNSAKFISDLGKWASLIIIDEAHSAVAETYRFILETLIVFRPGTALLGLTATPGRTWADIHLDEQLADFFERQKITLQIEGFRNPVDYLVSEQYLAEVEYIPLYHDGLEFAEVDVLRIQEELEIPDYVLKRLAGDERRNLLIIQQIISLAKRHWRIMVFATTVEHSDLLASVLRWQGLDATSITSKTPPHERKQRISSYKDDQESVKILCNYGVLTTGFDAPRTSAALIARPTKSLVLYSQMVGRAIRGKKAGGNKKAEIVTVVDSNLPGFGSVAEAFSNWEDIWE
jgi:superfamily II DNA or RNA helicase